MGSHISRIIDDKYQHIFGCKTKGKKASELPDLR